MMVLMTVALSDVDIYLKQSVQLGLHQVKNSPIIILSLPVLGRTNISQLKAKIPSENCANSRNTVSLLRIKLVRQGSSICAESYITPVFALAGIQPQFHGTLVL